MVSQRVLVNMLPTHAVAEEFFQDSFPVLLCMYEND